MPELPDVETFRRYVDATSLHQDIARVNVDAPRMLRGKSGRRFAKTFEQRRFCGTRRHGKFLFVETDGDVWLILHFGMTGFLTYWKDPEQRPEAPRLSIRFANGFTLAGNWPRRLGRIDFTEDREAFIQAQSLGPDACEISEADFLRKCRTRRGTAKSALMDQKFLAGLGNIYSDEVLFQARLHPRHSLKNLDDRDLRHLFRAMRHVLRLAIERKADPSRLPQSWLLPHRQENAHCPRCGGALERRRIGGRTTYLCPACQKAAGS